MPRNYVKKVKSYSEIKLQEALQKIKNEELSIREAEKEYNIDKSLLWRRIHNYNTSKQGRKTVLSNEMEKDLADKIKVMAKWGWALTRKEIRDIVHTYISQNNIRNNFKNDYPGKDWLKLFFIRNKLVGKKMEQLEKSRRQATSDPFIVYHFYDILNDTLTSLDLHNKPQHIYNLDETSFSSDPSRVKGVTGKGQKAHRMIQGSGKDNTTVLGCVSADGRLLPPLIIFKGQNLWNSWKGTRDIPGTTYACSDNGWMMTSIFNEWFANFCNTVKERPLLIIFDGHVTHLDPSTIELAVRENVALLKLPPHTTDLLQPMDRSCFGPIKYKWNEQLIAWQRLNQRPLSKSEFCDLLSDVWRDGLSQELIQNSFKVTGIYPVNKEVYPKDRLDPVKLARYLESQSSLDTIPDPFNIFEDILVENIDRVSPSITDRETPDIISALEQDVNSEPEPGTSTSSRNIILTDQDIASPNPLPTPTPELACSFETLLLSKIKHTAPKSNKRRKIDGKGKLLTTEDYLKSIENLDKKAKKPKNANTKKNQMIKNKAVLSDTNKGLENEEVKEVTQKEKPRKLSDTDSDLDEFEIPYQDESDVENLSLSELIDENQDLELEELGQNNSSEAKSTAEKDDHIEINQNADSVAADSRQDNELKYDVGDFVLVAHTLKNTKIHYIAKIEGVDDDETFSVLYLKRAKKIFFVYPDVRVKYSIRKDEIVTKLLLPCQKNKRGALIFDVDFEKYKIL